MIHNRVVSFSSDLSHSGHAEQFVEALRSRGIHATISHMPGGDFVIFKAKESYARVSEWASPFGGFLMYEKR